MNRRRLLGAGAAVAGAAAVVAAAPFADRLIRGGQPGVLLRSRIPLPPAYATPLPVPPVLRPVRTDATTDHYEITARPTPLTVLPGHRTTVWAYEGSFPGPTIESRSGRRTVVTHRNQLPHPTVVHLHGGHTPHDSDGYPLDLIAPLGPDAHAGAPSMRGMPGMPGTSATTSRSQRTYTYPMDQRAATLWYHDHTMGYTGPNVYRGLAGFHLVRDDEEDALRLPDGERELPLMITDRAFGADGSFAYPSLDADGREPGVRADFMNGVLGDVVLVNGAPWPVAEVDRARYRLRLLNASNARRYRLELDPQPPGGGALVQIGSDAGLLERSIPHDALELAPAERFDVIVDFSRYRPGTRVRLVNRLGSGSTAAVMRFDIGTATVHEPAQIPGRPARVDRLDPARARTHRTFVFSRNDDAWAVNGEPYRPGRALATPRLGDTEIWRFVSDFHHPVHVHLDPFRVLDRDGGGPGPYDAGMKDTVDVLPAQGVEVAVRFGDYAGRYLLHCHNLEHEDMAMMADFDTGG